MNSNDIKPMNFLLAALTMLRKSLKQVVTAALQNTQQQSVGVTDLCIEVTIKNVSQ